MRGNDVLAGTNPDEKRIIPRDTRERERERGTLKDPGFGEEEGWV